MVVSKFKFSCCYPVKVSDNSGKLYLRPCGKCINCKNKSSQRYANMINMELQKHKFNYMFTLSYDDEHINKCNVSCNIDNYRKGLPYVELLPEFETYDYNHNLIESYGFIENFSLQNYDEYINKINHRKDYKGKILVINIWQFQRFFKVLNSSFKCYLKKVNPSLATSYIPLRHFTLHEYGGKFKRPHVHCCVHTNYAEFSDYFNERIRPTKTRSGKYYFSLWKYGTSDIKLITDSGISPYLSNYISSTFSDVQMLSTKFAKAKVTHSLHYGDYFYGDTKTDLFKLSSMSVESYLKEVVKTPFGFLKPSQSSYINSYLYPKLPYSEFLDSHDVYTLLCYRKSIKQRIKQARQLTNRLYNKEVLKRFPKMLSTFVKLKRIINYSYYKRYKKFLLTAPPFLDYATNIIYCYLGISERWLNCHLGTYYEVIKLIEYHKLKDLQTLNDFYKLQEIYYLDKPFNEIDLQFFYINSTHEPNKTTFQKQINDINYKKYIKHKNKKLHNNLNFQV